MRGEPFFSTPLFENAIGGQIARGHTRLREKPPSQNQRCQRQYGNPLAQADLERYGRRVPGAGKEQQVRADDGNPIQGRGGVPAIRKADSTPIALSTKSSVEMKPIVAGKPTQARPVSRKQTASVGECP